MIISPQNLDDDVLQLLGDSKIQHLHLLQNRYTPASITITACSPKGWRLLRRDNPNLLVHLRVESTNNGEILLQPEAPVGSILYRTPETQVIICCTCTYLINFIIFVKSLILSPQDEII